ncbi:MULTISPECIES: DUF4123 domain-containing protein [unclassified Pseudomonas]|uniref:DUF4123 domain-containing protein n=1 Tax=unclassified Pseudomonas TaxID=196821 RepID=UPI002AC97BBB|nr:MULTISPECIES: DUF4123 domain-containing protein [unclassified Pseudomonas]MEB0041644.1 DUF4123 domain-containing protein [Pseudomonas sp. MH10]MEB0121980.1 DUF4123 domain-containing protein [Pseudomonas sp. CCI1.2]WPX61957.1 DUF4123 domain-containing protein [Pseudomonas sp. MH10]
MSNRLEEGWLLLDTPGVPGLAERFKQQFGDSHVWDELLADTELHLIRDQGPLLIQLPLGDPLNNVLAQASAPWPGLRIVCAAPKRQLLEHLRRMLTVRFGRHYKSLLTYYNVQTASYFFDAMDPLELSRWLGPIESLTWYGGPWAAKVEDTQGRKSVINPTLSVTPLTVEPELSVRQENNLRQCLLERHAYVWSRATGSNYRTTLDHIHEGLRHGFYDSTVLDNWLTLRARFPSASVPPTLPGDNPQQRFANLANYWLGGWS